ncbi:MAG: hypothetical protein IKN66_04170 [Ruminococcus sp.]|nr:hypothetical protein [Ruminococcus sp.]
MERFIELDAEDRLLEDAINMAFELLYANDKYLIDHQVNERSIVFRFAHYLQSELEKTKKYRRYNLDCEYNRNMDGPKFIHEDEPGVYPDLIIHRRGNNNNNLLIIEFKTYWNNDTTEDESKIREFVRMDRNYKYKYGFSIVFMLNYPKVKQITR